MRARAWYLGKLHAARTLTLMASRLNNWMEVWSAYRSGRTIPPLRFRRGFTLSYGDGDDPIALLHDVFGSRAYAAAGRLRDGVILDVGANIGLLTLDWACCAPAVEVHAYEPAPLTHARLEANVAANGLTGRVRVYREAMAGAGGTLDLFVSRLTVLSSAYPDATEARHATRVSVPAVTLRDAVARAGGTARLLKLDVEGAEADILGAADTATLRAIDRVALEYHDALVPGALDRCLGALRSAGFACRVRRLSTHQGILHARREP